MPHLTYLSSPIGKIKITADDHAVVSILFVENEDEQATEVTPLLQVCCTQLREYFDKKRKIFDFPMRQQGTEFQQRVWGELSKIPYGTTTTYGVQALRLGDAKGVRAVAAANGKNKLWIAVPCHRVVGKGGSLTGYAGGLWRKQWLLDHESNLISNG
jgi:methylated-DNA-[protein]-cysteine S-methyltransferase